MSYFIPVIAVGCSFLLDRSDIWKFWRGAMLFVGGLLCGVLVMVGKP
jgi:hypothetical protein